MSKQYEVHLTFGGVANDGQAKQALVKASTNVNGKTVTASGYGEEAAIEGLKDAIADAVRLDDTKASLPKTVMVEV